MLVVGFLYVLRVYLTDCSMCVIVDGWCNPAIYVVSGVPQGSILGVLVIIVLYTRDLFDLVENELVSHTDDSTLPAFVNSFQNS